ncbi:MPN domain-containing protein-like [Clytia hemisphaerica]|uniref:MPN domain-containing protein-like n=1 Tax=Clytia hemisphaerica TaxID=252671 RepID=UPI0034D5A1E2
MSQQKQKCPIYTDSSSGEDSNEESEMMIIDEDINRVEASPKIKAANKTENTKNKRKSLKSPLQAKNKKDVSKSHKPTTSHVTSSPVSNITNSPKSNKKKRNLMLTGRGVTTQMLIEEQILEPGEKALTIDYLGRKFTGDLINDGTILCHNANQIFSSPSAWAMACKQEVNPGKKSGCGWASVRYKGRKLDEFKSTWFRKQKIEQQVAASSEIDPMSPAQYDDPSFKPKKYDTKEQGSSLTGRPSSDYVPPTDKYITFSEALKAVQSRQPHVVMSKMNTSTVASYAGKLKDVSETSQLTVKDRKKTHRTRLSVKHSMLQINSDPTTLVECAQFTSTGKIQPFSITISTSALLLIDFHCHLTTSEVSGYLAGKWDSARQHIRVTQSFPCKYHNDSSDQQVQAAENQIRDEIERNGLMLVGWYHSHPFWQPDPSIHDIDSQLQYQKVLKDRHYEPCVGLIVSPYDSYRKESQFNAFWVREPNDNKSIGLPLQMKFTTQQDQELTQDVINNMVDVVNFHQAKSDIVKFTEMWSAEATYLEKLKHSVIRKFPQNQTDGRFLDFIHKMVSATC